MLIVPPQIKVFASLAPTDMRKSFTGLIGIVEKELGQQIENGRSVSLFQSTTGPLEGAVLHGRRHDHSLQAS